MNTITIHDLDAPVLTLLKEKAKAEKTSMNKLVKSLLEQALGVTVRSNQPHRADFEEFCGGWTADDLKKFNANIAEFSSIDPEMWK